MTNQKSNTNIAEIWDQIRSVFLDELQSVPKAHDNFDFLQNLVSVYKPLNPHISYSVVSIAMTIMESLWTTDNTYQITFDQIIGSFFDCSTRIENDHTKRDPQIFLDMFEEILNYALILPFNTISDAFTTCNSFIEFKKFIKKYNQKENLQFKGRYYTPQEMASFIVERTLSDFNLNENAIILDLCAGTGSFAIQICHKLFTLYSNSSQNLSPIEIKKKIINIHLRTIDVDPIATYILRIQLILWFLDSSPEPEEIQDFLSNLIKATKIGNILEDLEIFEHKFHYIISNPPYLSEKTNKRYIDLMIKSKSSEFYKPRLDFYLHFLAYAFKNVESNGKLGFIIPTYFTDTKSAAAIREHLFSHTSDLSYYDYGDRVVFSKAPGFHSCVFTCNISSNRPSNKKELTYINQQNQKSRKIPYSDVFLTNFEYMMKFTPKPDFGGIESYRHTLGDIAEIRQGVVAGPDRLRKNNLNLLGNANLSHNQGVFVLSNEEVTSLELSKQELKYLLSFSYVRDLKKKIPLQEDPMQSKHQIIYLNDSEIEQSEIPNLLHHLKLFKPIMDARRENQMEKRQWYELHWPRTRKIFTDSRILCVRRVEKPRFILIETPLVTDLSTNIIIPRVPIDIKKLYNYLVSPEITEWITYFAKNKGKMLQIDKSVLMKIPVPDDFTP